jgi:hypothetical protein
MGNGTASADPARLEAAAHAVPALLRIELVYGHRRLEDLLETFSTSPQSPDRIFINPDYITGWMGRAYGRGAELDERLMRIARAFRDAGDDRPPGFVGPLVPSAVMYLGDAALQHELDRWDDPLSLELRPRDGGGYEVRGPDGEWYAVATAPPAGAVPLDRRQGVVDLGNPDFGVVLGTAFVLGITGASTQPSSRPAPPEAYDYIHLDENGYPVAGPGVTGQSAAPGSLPPDDNPVPVDTSDPRRPRLNPGGMSLAEARGERLGMIAGGISEANKYADEQHRNVYRTQATYYVDGQGERVAVIDAASIRYDNDSNEAIVTSGRLSSDDRGQPEIVPQPPDPITCLPPDESRTSFRVPLEES